MREGLRLSWLIVRRHWMVYRKDFLANISPTVVEPLFFLLSMGLGLGHYVSEVAGQSYAVFLAPGLVMSAAMFTAFFESSYNVYIRFNYDKTYQSMLTTPIGVKEIIFGELIWMFLKAACMALGVGIVLSFFGVVYWPNLIFIPVVGAMVGLSCGALGLIATSLVKNINQFQSVYTVLITPMFFFSGIFFPVSDLPGILPAVANLSPLFHGVKMSQALLWNELQLGSFTTHFFVLMSFCLVLTSVAYVQFKKMLFK